MAYTEHEKAGFVERMWAEGLRPATAHRLWGSPARESLRKWELRALAGELPAERPPQRGRAEHAKHARWPEETRAEALRLADQGVPTRQIALRLGLPAGAGTLISGWRRRRATMSGEGAVGMAGGRGGGKGAPTRAELEAEVDVCIQ